MDGGKSDGGGQVRLAEALKQLKVLREEAEYDRARINALEGRVPNFEHPQRAYSVPDQTARTEVTDDTEFGHDYTFLTAKDTIPEVRECNYAQFKNRFDPQGKDGCYAIDVLLSGDLLQQEIEEEHRLRDKLFEDRGPAMSRVAKNRALAKVVKAANANTDFITEVQDETWPRRIRIQSPALLRILARANREKWSDRPRTYYRPFHSLIYQHERMKKALEELEERWGPQLDGFDAASSSSSPRDENGEADDDDSVDDSPEALACLRAYVEYVDEKIMPDYHQFDGKDSSSSAKVCFSDLWYLFRTGELLYRNGDGELPSRRDWRTGKHIWRAYFVETAIERQVAAASDEPEIGDPEADSEEGAFKVGCYYIDYNGTGFCVVSSTFEIAQYPGEMFVSALPVFPIRFCPDWKERRENAIRTGDSLIDFIKAKHCFYSGWTLTRSPSGEPIPDTNGNRQQQPEHINSEVMVDFNEAFQAYPAWRPQPAKLQLEVVEGQILTERFRIRWWSGEDRSSLLGETTEVLPWKSGVTRKQRNKYLAEDRFLVAIAKNAKRSRPTTEEDLNDDAKALLTGRVFGYVFEERKFAQLAVAKLRSSPKTGLALESLRIPPAVKDAIQGAVQGHFLQKNAARQTDHEWTSLDLIQGKGAGLFILLHGVSGVGKTATAEAMAQANGKPLFKMTVGDLGMTPEKLETSLREVFRLSSIWDCILLLDEVDTFFSQRSRADTATNKNALVSVFLRVLDYYDGILFLTTNRAGVLDEAFKSRIHLKIYYPNLTLEQTVDIWKLNIQRVSRMEEELARVESREPLKINEKDLVDFARLMFDEGGKQKIGRWNGRQIRNAFQVARSLAYYEHGMRQEQLALRQPAGNPDAASVAGPPTLDVVHFRTMYDITASFENYRVAVHGGTTDSDMALEAEFRHDAYHDPLTRGWQANYRAEHLRGAAGPGGDGDDQADGDTVTATVEVTSRMQRSRQQHGAEGGDYSGADNHAQHRGSIGQRHPSDGFLPEIHTHPQQRPTPSPRLGPSRAVFPNQQIYGTSPSGGVYMPRASGYNPSAPYGGGELSSMMTTPRGPSMGFGEGGMPQPGMGGGREQGHHDFYNSGGISFSTTSHEGPGMRRATGSFGSAAALGIGGGYGNRYPSHGRDPQSGAGQNPERETDLGIDDY